MSPPAAALNVTTVFQLIVHSLNIIHKNEPQPKKNEVSTSFIWDDITDTYFSITVQVVYGASEASCDVTCHM